MTPTYDESKYSQTEYGNQLKRLFRPEFLNRIDEIIVFEPLTRDADSPDRAAADERHQQAHGRAWLHRGVVRGGGRSLAEIGYDPSYGARPLRRLLQRRVENELSKRLLRGECARATMCWSISRRRTPRARTSSPLPSSSRRRSRWSCR
jgi:ATP-dependent Clp protease ATP-binding subunit ClpA